MRNFGLTSRPASGAQPLTGSLAPNTQRNNVIRLPVRTSVPGADTVNSLPQQGEPFIHPLEFGSHFLFFAVLFFPAVIVGGIVIGYLAFVA